MYTYFKGRLGGIGEVLNIGGMGLKHQAKKTEMGCFLWFKHDTCDSGKHRDLL